MIITKKQFTLYLENLSELPKAIEDLEGKKFKLTNKSVKPFHGERVSIFEVNLTFEAFPNPIY